MCLLIMLPLFSIVPKPVEDGMTCKQSSKCYLGLIPEFGNTRYCLNLKGASKISTI